MRTIFLLAPILLLSFGCSTQWREGKTSVSEADVASYLQEAEGAQGASVQATTLGSSVVYFAMAEENSEKKDFGVIANVLSFVDFRFLGYPETTTFSDFNNARVFFIQDAGGQVRLIFGLGAFGGNGLQYVSFSGSGAVNDGVFTANLTGATGSIQVVSYDVVEGELGDVIQIRVFDAQDQYVGKVATMVGFVR